MNLVDVFLFKKRNMSNLAQKKFISLHSKTVNQELSDVALVDSTPTCAKPLWQRQGLILLAVE